MRLTIVSAASLVLAAFSQVGSAQLEAPGERAAAIGHLHLTVPDADRHREIWKLLGAEETSSGALQMLALPGAFVILTEGEPAAPSRETTVNHIGFSVQDYAAYKARLQTIGADFFFDSEANGQIIADLPDGVRVEFLTDPEQAHEIEFHHIHLAAPDADALRDWYVDVLGAEPGERRGLPSAVLPGGRVDILPGENPLPSRGTAIDHVGFEVADMQTFAAHAERAGIEFDRAPVTIDAIGLTIAFFTDPIGTYIEITEGLYHAGRNP